jgi:parallel beta-helix repeat protein
MTTYSINPSMTLGYVLDLPILPGDVVEFQAGGVWDGELDCVWSGQTGRPIVIRAQTPGPRPTLGGLQAVNRHNLFIQGLDIGAQGIHLMDSCKTCQILDCRTTGGDISVKGIGYQGTIVKRCSVKGATSHGISASGEEHILDEDGNVVTPVRKIEGVTISGCTVQDVVAPLGYGIKLLFADWCAVRCNTATGCAASGINLDGNRGLDKAVDEQGCDHNVISRNRVINCAGAGINLEVSSSNQVVNNLVTECGLPGQWYGGIHMLWRSGRNLIQENDVYANKHAGPNIGIADAGSVGNVIKSNIVIAPVGGIGLSAGGPCLDGLIIAFNILSAPEYPYYIDALTATDAEGFASDLNALLDGTGMGDFPQDTFEEWQARGFDLNSTWKSEPWPTRVPKARYDSIFG